MPGCEVEAPALTRRERDPVQSPRTPFESADTVNRVIALLVRFPELHSIRSNPADGSVTLSYAVKRRLDRDAVRAFADDATEHIRAFLELHGEAPAKLTVAFGTRRGDYVRPSHPRPSRPSHAKN